ncbi:4-hydroxyphenylpyruvate dioxygenase [Gloeocapsopsis dulcis]|uniref:4-hydroxyphenylpyruvate dioxygenase n=1 Tax=Gloeocapsopsis dulcis AAB1 = 1H9 TaxID=1433147 RepID=A0A6N8FVT9_9CHRO|nr:4-hydroxyphenylpyruvate dioxygenase [Gloeocapsopsis dulcis]MUL37240.1 4-hydroxyphenylpyruvate dioxygenase [Gloeocapsopsis dulcis AAB1 = 1H9]WNN90149.1 4-hydroxyphenylpyruvate dioxygenase [Gloeocapsopsis dulcis]
MRIDHVHFYVEDAQASSNWFVQHLGFQSVTRGVSDADTYTEVIKSGTVYFVLSSPLSPQSPVAYFLQQHPPGVADIAFSVEDIDTVWHQAIAHGAKVLQPLEQRHNGQKDVKSGKIAGWGSLSHTLIEQSKTGSEAQNFLPVSPFALTGIDHIVLNVAAGDLERAVTWYQDTLGFQTKQSFKIHTDRSGLHSQVLVSRDRQVQLPINEPASTNSQIQEFLDINRGSGIQHIALQTTNIVSSVAKFRAWGLSFLPVPSSYYTQLQARQIPLSADEFQEIARQQILVDWQDTNPDALLLQIFTQPIFGEPTFFFELIERRRQAPGFGEGNFRALFEAIEREQIKRGSLQNDYID